jgi:hypothetical protein
VYSEAGSPEVVQELLSAAEKFVNSSGQSGLDGRSGPEEVQSTASTSSTTSTPSTRH